MARLTIDTGTVGNTATGDSIRGAFTKVNANFEEIYNELGSSGILSDLSFSGNTISTDGTNQNLILDPNGTGKVIVEGTVELGGLSFDSQTITGLTTNSNIKLAPAGTGSIDVDTSRIINVTDPTSAQDAATKNYVDTQLSSSSHNITFVGDDSTGTAVTQGETFKFAGTQNITTAVSGDTLTITGPDLTNYLNSTQISVSGNKISTTESNANIELDPNGTGDVIVNSGDILPATDNTQYLGSASKRWHTVYVGPGSINLGGAVISNTGGVVSLPGVNTVGYRPSEINGGAPGAPPSYPLADSLGTPFTFTDVPVIIDQVTYGLATGQIVLAPGVSYTRATYTATMSNPGVDGTVDNITITDPGSIYPTGENFETINQDNMWALPAGTDLTDLSAINSAIQAAVEPYGVMSTGITSEARSVTNTSTLTDFSTITGTPTTLSGYGITDAISSGSTAVTIVGDDSTGTGLNIGETFKIAGTQNVTTAVSGDTLTITGPDLTNYLNSTQITVSGNKISTTESNADIELDPNGTGNIIINSGDVLPLSDNIQSLGSADKRWKDVHIGPGSLIAYTPVGAAITLGYLALSKLYDYAQSTAQTSSLNLLKQIEDAGFTADTATATKNQQDSGFTIQSDGSTSNFVISNSLSNGNVDIVPNGTGKVNIDNIEISANEITTNTTDADLTLTPNGTGSVVADTVTIKDRVISTSDSDADITITPTGTGSVIADTIKFKANEILPTAGNTNLTLSGTGTGKVISSKPHQFNAGYIENINTLTSSSTISVDCSIASVHTVTLAENTQFVITNLPTGGTVTLIITQDGGGTNTASFGTDGSTAVKFAGGTPTLSTAGNAIDVVTIFNDGTNYLGNIAKAYA